MCYQKVILENIKKREGMGGLSEAQMDLAEASAMDMEKLDQRMDKVEEKVDQLYTQQSIITDKQETIINKLSKLDEVVGKAHGFDLITSIISSWKFWVILIIMLCAVGLAGEQLVNRVVPEGQGVSQTQIITGN